MIKQVEQRFAERDNMAHQMSTINPHTSVEREPRSLSNLPTGGKAARQGFRPLVYGDDQPERPNLSQYNFNPQRSPERTSKRLGSPAERYSQREQPGRQDSIGDPQPHISSTIYRERTYDEHHMGTS